MNEFCMIYVTASSPEEAQKIGQCLVEENLSRCVNILEQMRSIYTWQDKLQNSMETVLIIKSAKAQFKKIESRILELHSYETPCIISWDIDNGNQQYLNWLRGS